MQATASWLQFGRGQTARATAFDSRTLGVLHACTYTEFQPFREAILHCITCANQLSYIECSYAARRGSFGGWFKYLAVDRNPLVISMPRVFLGGF